MNKNKIISPYIKDDSFIGVRVKLGTEDFVIASNDFRGSKDMKWDDAMSALGEKEIGTWSYRQACITLAYLEDINLILIKYGGKGLFDEYWICAIHSQQFPYFLSTSEHSLQYLNKNIPLKIRPILNNI